MTGILNLYTIYFIEIHVSQCVQLTYGPRPFILVSSTLYQGILFIAPYLTGLKRKKGENLLSGLPADLQFQFARRTLIRDAFE